MLDTLSLDQLRLFIAAAEEGSFSAAGRRLNRAQSVISQTILNLEAQLGVALFDRSGRYPVLTDQGRILLADAKGILRATDSLKARAKGMAAGLEPELSVVVDVMFPMRVLTKVAALFGTVFPGTSLRLYVEALGGVAKAVLSRQCALGVMGSLTLERPELLRERLLGVRMVVVTSPRHALAAFHGPIPRCMLADHLQLVLTDRTDLSEGQEFNVLSPRNWRLADMSAKHAFLREGLGWGSMPFDMVERDLAEGELVEIELQDADGANFIMPMYATYRTDAPPGPAGRWLINRLKEA
ncbi:LysR family transcriptional regulator [Rhodomicrobium lacus]|uniref:LysR family transcriptional regulator n=1 Tax=Rhodomicrobium lacus TaxID=2498452 RepID=UPI000F8F1D39|nr:LysR family transcriptional regulator [Rhodomicrobium lacus]